MNEKFVVAALSYVREALGRMLVIAQDDPRLTAKVIHLSESKTSNH
jgi:hypothetical protein